MTNDNEQPEANNEPPVEAVYGPEPAPAAPEAAPVAALPVAERSRWRPSRTVVTIAGAAVGGVLLFGSGIAVGHAVDRHSEHRPDFMRQIGTRGAPDGQRLQPRNDQTQPRDGNETPGNGGQTRPRDRSQTQPRNGGQAQPQSDSGGG